MHTLPAPLSSPHIRKTLGIDPGTTNSVIALLDPTDSALLTGADEQGRKTFPSVVGWHPEQGRLVVGRAATALCAADAVNNPLTLPLSSVKRFMGLDRQFPLGPESLTPAQASACILRLLRDVMARTLNDGRYLLDSAIITMPAYFNHGQIEATRQAGELAGYEVVELLHEPTAAAIYYSWVENHDDATYLVYDLGGGTFDVSIIRRRLGDYEVISVSGDPFLGGDDFDRLLATYLLENGAWRGDKGQSGEVACLFDLGTPAGTANFGRLVQIAERIKVELTQCDRVERYVPAVVADEQGRSFSLEVSVERTAFERLIRDKVSRTVDCCHEALARAHARVGLHLRDVDYVILVGGSSRVPLVRATVRAAFCNADLPEHVRCLEPLLHEPDLCVAYGAALRAATHGTRYRFRIADCGLRIEEAAAVELHLTSPLNTRDVSHLLTGVVRRTGVSDNPQSTIRNPQWDGVSVRIRSLVTGLSAEAFVDERGSFAQEMELQPETDNPLELTVCDGAGDDWARVVVAVRHQGAARALGPGVLPTQIITRPLQIEVLDRSRQRVKQVVAGVGAPLPGTFSCTCRTIDQAGQIVVPIFEDNRVIKKLVIGDLDPDLPVGSPVEVELVLDVKHNIHVRVRVRPGEGRRERCETATIEAPPPPHRPTRAEIEEVQRQIDELLPQFRGSYRTRVRSRVAQLRQDLAEALRYDDEPRAIQRMAELRDLLEGLEANRGQVLDPPWPRFTQMVRDCLDLAADVAKRTGRAHAELFEHIHAQERYAEQAYEENNQPLYRECWDNLGKYGSYLNQLLRDSLPRAPARPTLPPEEEARQAIERFRSFLAQVWKKVRELGRKDLEARLNEIASQARGLSQRGKDEPEAAIREVRRLGTEVEKVAEQVEGGPRLPPGEAGLLEGTS